MLPMPLALYRDTRTVIYCTWKPVFSLISLFRFPSPRISNATNLFSTFLSRFFSLADLISCISSIVNVYFFIPHHHAYYTHTRQNGLKLSTKKAGTPKKGIYAQHIYAVDADNLTKKQKASCRLHGAFVMPLHRKFSEGRKMEK